MAYRSAPDRLPHLDRLRRPGRRLAGRGLDRRQDRPAQDHHGVGRALQRDEPRLRLLGAIHQTLGITGGLICGLVIDRIGRRNWFIFAFFGSAICLASYWALGITSLWALFIATSANQFCMGSVANSLGIYTAELYPTRIRAIGISLGQAWSRTSSSIGPAMLGFLLPSYGIGVALLAIAGISLVCGLVVVIQAPETKAAVLETLSP